MPATPVAPQQPGQKRLSTTAKLLLFVLLPLVVISVLVGAVLAALSIVRGAAAVADLSYDAAGGSSVAVDVANARFDVLPSDDGEVHVNVTGSYTGQTPRLKVRTVGDRTVIDGGCVDQLFARCSLVVSLAIPASADFSLESTNGRVRAAGLTGDVDIRTTNGALELADMSGALTLRTNNGAITLRNISSGDVSARTTNGAVQVGLVEAPASVEATSTNGSITVRVPDDAATYSLDARTTNGSVAADDSLSDDSSDRSITATTTNGSVTVERVSR